jgi:hypothetical protein
MTYQNNSHKNATHAKTANTKSTNTKATNTKAKTNTKASGTLKSTTATKSKVTAKNATHSNKAIHAKKTNKTFQAQDIKSLIHNQGRAKLGGQEWCLKAPSWSDSTLQAIISDPKLSARATGKPTADGRLSFELRGHGKTINVTIGY